MKIPTIKQDKIMLKENLIKIYEASFREHRELPALSDYFQDGNYSYYEMAKEIAKLHLLFREAGIRQGDKIALVGRNNPRWVIAYVASITYGAVIVPILQEFTMNDINHIVCHSESKLIFMSDHVWEALHETQCRDIRAVFSLSDYRCLFERSGSNLTDFQKNVMKHFRSKYPRGFMVNDISYPDIPNDRVCLLSYTSGTTGFSKGVMLTVNNLTGQVTFCLPKKRHFPGSRVLAFLPLGHAYGAAIDMLCSLAAGSHITLLGKMPAPKILLEALAAVKPNVVCSVPLVLEKIVRKQVFPLLGKGWMKAALKVPVLDTTIYNTIRKKLLNAFGGEAVEIVIGGAPLNYDVEEFLHKIKFPVVVGYGMTECGPLISYSEYGAYKPHSVGAVAAPNMQVKIDSPDPANIPGEILAKGEHVMAGYYKSPKLTKEAFTEDGWLRTGDMGTLDEDNVIYIKGRCKTMILLGNGQNIYPESIEAKLNNMHCVMESLVIEREGRLVALVVPDYEQADIEGLPVSKLAEVMDENLKDLNAMLASYEKVSEIVLFPKEFEKSPNRSIKRYLYTNI